MQVFKNLIVSLSLISLALSPVIVSAEIQQKYTAVNFCSRIANIKTDISTKLTDLENVRTQKRADIFAKLKERKDARIEQVQKTRDEAEQKLEEKLNDLENSATTDEQKQAIVDFKAAVDVAQATRRAAVDAD